MQDYDETYPSIRFHQSSAPGDPDRRGKRIDCWRNAIIPYLKSVDVFACPSNPFSRSVPGQPGHDPPNRGDNAEGWEWEPEQRMPISYGMNSCATNWIPRDDPNGSPPLRQARVVRPADTILISESQWPSSDVHAGWLFGICPGLFAHSTGRVGNFIFFDGHARSKKWLATLYPLNENNWELSPNPDPKNRMLNGAPACTGPVPAGPDAKEFQTKECLANQ